MLKQQVVNENLHESEIDKLVQVAPYIKGLLGDEIGVYVSDDVTMRYAHHGHVKLNIKAGEKVTRGSVTDRTLKEGNRVVARVGKEKFGVPYIGTGQPIKNKQNQVIGTIVLVTPITMQENLSNSAKLLEDTVNTILSAINDLVVISEKMASTSNNLSHTAQSINTEIKKTDEVGALITDISERTHMLGLNAAIEAARAGEQGRGFAIVANEIRKMSGDTKVSVKEIKENLKEMKNSLGELVAAFEQIAAISQTQTASTQEISAAVNNLMELATELKKDAEKLIN